MNQALEALENIKFDMEYVTRLDFVEPIVRGEVQQELYKIYHRETPELDIIEKELKDKEKTDKLLEFIKKYVFVSKPFGSACYICLNDEREMISEEEYNLLKEAGL